MPQAYAQELVLPKPGVMVHLSPPLNPPLLKGIKVYANNPFKFDFILDQGDGVIPAKAGIQQQEQLKTEANRLIRYFLASLTVPDKDLWVNLSPYEKKRIIPDAFGKTEMGRDLLAQDYLLKQITASLIYPEEQVGKEFWQKVYTQAQQKFGTTNIPINTFNKVWIVPAKAIVYENTALSSRNVFVGDPKKNNQSVAYVVEAKLKVMLEQDYLAVEKSTVIPAQAGIQNKNDINAIGSQVVREIVIPQLEQEVNEGKNFAPLRQVYHSLILAAWYKQKIKKSILAKVYADKNKVVGVGYKNSLSLDGVVGEGGDIEAIYNQYLQAFKKGVFNYIKEESDLSNQELIPRKYFSGGVSMAMTSMADPAMSFTNKLPTGLGKDSRAMVISAGAQLPQNEMMISKKDREYIEKLRTYIKSAMDRAYEIVGDMDVAREYGRNRVHLSPLSHDIIVQFLKILRSGEYAKDLENNTVDVRVLKIIKAEKHFQDYKFLLVKVRGEEVIIVPTWQAFFPQRIAELGIAERLPKALIVLKEELNDRMVTVMEDESQGERRKRVLSKGFLSINGLDDFSLWSKVDSREDITESYSPVDYAALIPDAAMTDDSSMSDDMGMSLMLNNINELLLKGKKFRDNNFYIYYEIINNLSEENKTVLDDAINGLVQVLAKDGKVKEDQLRRKVELEHPMGVFFALSIYIMQETANGRAIWGDSLEGQLRKMLAIYNDNILKWNKELWPFGLLDLSLFFHLPLSSFITDVDQLIKLSNSIMLFPDGEWKDRLVAFDLIMMGIHANVFLYDNDSPDLDIVVPSLEYAVNRLINAPASAESKYLERGVVSALWLLGERQFFVKQNKEPLYLRALEAFNKLGRSRVIGMVDVAIKEQELSKHFPSWLIRSNLNHFLFFLGGVNLTAADIILDSHLDNSQDCLMNLKKARSGIFNVEQDLSPKKEGLMRSAQLINDPSMRVSGDVLKGVEANTGGIDLTSGKLPLEVNKAVFSATAFGGDNMDFNIDPAMLKQWEEAPGVEGVIFNIEPMQNIYQFLGVANPDAIVNQSS